MRFSLIAVIVVVISAACSSSESAPKTPKASAPTAGDAIVKAPMSGRVEVKATKEGFSPSRIEAKAGQPLKLVFIRDEEKTCMTGVVFPELKIEKDLPLHTPVEIEVTPKANGEIAFQCPMGMGKSAIVGVP